MKLRRPWRKELDPLDRLHLEGLLQSTIKPVAPSLSFVSSLEARLLLEGDLPETRAVKSLTSYILIFATLGLAISMITVTGIRIAIALLGIFGLVHQVNKNLYDQDEKVELISQ